MVGLIPGIRRTYAPNDPYEPTESERHSQDKPLVWGFAVIGGFLIFLGAAIGGIVGLLFLLPGLIFGMLSYVLFRRGQRSYLRTHRRDPAIPKYAQSGYADWGGSNTEEYRDRARDP